MRKIVFSPAKINIGLSIVGKREDGFHLLESLFWPLSFGDQITMESGEGRVNLKWATDAPFSDVTLPSEADNIVTKVLRAVPEPYSKINIQIDKNIPMGGGLGGGSSNIGTILRHLNLPSTVQGENLKMWSSKFGADIPFFLDSKPAWVTGVGENVVPLTLVGDGFNRLSFLLVLFPFGCETKLIFNNYQKSGSNFSNSVAPFINGALDYNSFIKFLKTAQNDLEPIVAKLYPEIRSVLNKLKLSDCLYSGLSGSGATCFAIFESQQQQEKTAKELHSFFRSNHCKSISAETFLAR